MKSELTENNEYTPWKATRSFKRSEQASFPIKRGNKTWATNNEEKADVMASHLGNVFQPHPVKHSKISKNEDIENLIS